MREQNRAALKRLDNEALAHWAARVVPRPGALFMDKVAAIQ